MVLVLRKLSALTVNQSKFYRVPTVSLISDPSSLWLDSGQLFRKNRFHQCRHRCDESDHRQYKRNSANLVPNETKLFSSLARRDFEEDNPYFDEADSNIDEDIVDEQQDEALSYQPWKSLLETPARAAWRASDPPAYLRDAMHRILDDGKRTFKQLKRAHRKVLSVQSNLSELRERERRLLVNGKRHFKQQEKSSNNENNSREGRKIDHSNDTINPVVYGYDETLATLKHRLGPNFAITRRVLLECQSLLGGKVTNVTCGNNKDKQIYSRHWQPKRILDFGIGCGSASAAAIDLFGSTNINSGQAQSSSSAIEWIHGIDPSQTMRECSKKLIEEMTRGHDHIAGPTESDNVQSSQIPPPPPRITFSNSLTPSSNESSSAGEGSFDLALFVYTASDLPNVSSCLAAAALAFEKLKPNGVFVMIEPGTPDGFNSIRAVRNMLLDCCPPHDQDFEWEDRCHIIAPCTHNGRCPMERHKKKFFSHKKPIGKLGYDLPQERKDDEMDIEGDNSDDEYDPMEYENDDGDQDIIELNFDNSQNSSETEAFNSSFCSFVHSMTGDKQNKGEKFSYLVAQKQRFRLPSIDANGDIVDPSTEGDPFRHDNITNLLTDALDAASLQADDLAYRTFESAQDLNSRYTRSENDDLGLELLQGEDKRQSMGRIIRAPIKKKGHVYVDYCADPGRIIRSRVSKALSNSVAPGIYAAARKSRWGGFWPDTKDKTVSQHYINKNKETEK